MHAGSPMSLHLAVSCHLLNIFRCKAGEEAGPDLAHAWDEAPGGLQEDDDSHELGGLGPDAQAAPSGPKHWTCQVRHSHTSLGCRKAAS